jgi:hypothetical protein
MFAGTSGGGGSIEEGLLSCPSDVCGPAVMTPGASAAGFADMTVGRVGVAARALSNPPEVYNAQGLSSIQVNDTLFASGNLIFNIRVDVGLNASNGEDTFAEYDFVLTLSDNPDEMHTLFSFSAWDNPNGEGNLPEGRGASYQIDRFGKVPARSPASCWTSCPRCSTSASRCRRPS